MPQPPETTENAPAGPSGHAPDLIAPDTQIDDAQIATALEESAEEFAGLGWHKRLLAHIPAGQFFRYLCVGVFNTLFGYTTFVLFLSLLNRALPQRYLYLTVILAAVLSNPINITVAFLGYKFLVFRTRGRFLSEWAKCFAVYGVGMLPGLVALSALTRLLQSVFHRHSALLHSWVFSLEQHLHGSPLHMVQHAATGKAMAGYVSGGLLTAATTVYSFIGHKKVTFSRKPETSAAI